MAFKSTTTDTIVALDRSQKILIVVAQALSNGANGPGLM